MNILLSILLAVFVYLPLPALDKVQEPGNVISLNSQNNNCHRSLSDVDLFNSLVEEFECSANFAETYKRVQIQFGAKDNKGKYKACFIFYNDKTWTKYKILLNNQNISELEDAVSLFRNSLEGVEIKDKSFYIRFKKHFPDELIKKSLYSEINFNNDGNH